MRIKLAKVCKPQIRSYRPSTVSAAEESPCKRRSLTQDQKHSTFTWFIKNEIRECVLRAAREATPVAMKLSS